MSNRPPLYLGAYAASPNTTLNSWEPRLEEEFFRGLSATAGVQGLELPFYGRLHPHDADWLIRNFDPHWNAVLTCLPGTMNRLKETPAFGLASGDESARRAAVEFLNSARQAADQLNQAFGKKVVQAIQIHSAPTAQATFDGFSKSLEEVHHWDWFGTELWVEHCDAAIAGQTSAKGFLSLDDELRAISPLEGVGLCINWGRSAIEARDPAAPRDHLVAAESKGKLRALFFSGATVGHSEYGDWKDSHAPFASTAMKSRDPDQFEKLLMTEAHVLKCLKSIDLGSLGALGIKIQPLPATLTLGERLKWVEESIAFFELCCSKASSAGMTSS